jgi:hypothetical protein
MRRCLIFAATVISIGVAFSSSRPAGAFVADQSGIAQAATAANTVIEVKRSLQKGSPPGWHHGRKRGWEGSKRPPGQH